MPHLRIADPGSGGYQRSSRARRKPTQYETWCREMYYHPPGWNKEMDAFIKDFSVVVEGLSTLKQAFNLAYPSMADLVNGTIEGAETNKGKGGDDKGDEAERRKAGKGGCRQ
ncbi:MAG: hypothetical protein M1837_003631 [Sclerophora amabilis]|nr:MAG: hypothetical protein M1837_003631 [Sclerophora amabilis]